MKYLLIFWAGPILFLGGWYYLSLNDISFGFFMLTRRTHDLVFQIYGKVLGIPPADIPPLVMRAMCVDSVLLFSLLAFRRRAKIRQWWRLRQLKSAQSSKRDIAASEESLSSAP
ncbi:DUF6105 family protein [Allorhizobium sp. BGMRC 0089]|uniref:DUF6105 family protein n=1 Tax=Allorhizobium sonneratiae TaxID=2934936 RepID=UPI0020335033|nr:DUF6105 family protein [Allorhizobium sonneratiae]MCM2294288.1 DUF6105 family protein [Allorhizobium sonneratiae]